MIICCDDVLLAAILKMVVSVTCTSITYL